jgi:hypothetical protein
MVRIKAATLAVAGLWLVTAAPAHAGCGLQNQPNGRDNAVYQSCGANGMTQLANAFVSVDQSMAAPVSQGPIYPVNNGEGRYICTPSGFGHLATCSLRGTN